MANRVEEDKTCYVSSGEKDDISDNHNDNNESFALVELLKRPFKSGFRQP